MKNEVMKMIMAHIDALGNALDIYSWGGCIYAMFEDELCRFRHDGNTLFISHCGFGKGCIFSCEEEFEINKSLRRR
jgi:hypothetical protein